MIGLRVKTRLVWCGYFGGTTAMRLDQICRPRCGPHDWLCERCEGLVGAVDIAMSNEITRESERP